MKKILIIACSLLLLCGCGKMIDGIRPKSAITSEQLSESDLSKLINGTANQMENLMATVWFDGDFLAENFGAGPGFSYSDVHALTQSPSSSTALSVWQSAFQKLATVNELKSAADKASAGATKDRAIGSACFYRAYVYYILVRRFGGVPILESPSENVIPISPEADVWEMITRDLSTAESLLTEFRSCYYPSKESVWAFMARVQLWLGNMTQAETYAKKVISSPYFELENSSAGFGSMFINGTSTKEAVFMFANNRTSDYRDIYTKVNDTDGSWNYAPAAKYFDSLYDDSEFGTGDIRKAPTFNASDPTRIIKFPNGRSELGQFVDNPNPMASPFMFLRLADMYLVLAEAQGNNAQGRATLKTFMEKRYATVNLPAAMDDAKWKNLLMDENQREFFGEGHRWFDIKRLRRTDLYDTWENRDFLLYWPIPQDERDKAGHDAYPQNKGY